MADYTDEEMADYIKIITGKIGEFKTVPPKIAPLRLSKIPTPVKQHVGVTGFIPVKNTKKTIVKTVTSENDNGKGERMIILLCQCQDQPKYQNVALTMTNSTKNSMMNFKKLVREEEK